MKILRGDQEQKITEIITEYENRLRSNSCILLSSVDHIQHIAAYVAWLNVGGKISIKAPFLTKEQSDYIDNVVVNSDYHDALFFHTSGTTGAPKVVVHQKKQMDQMLKMSTNAMEWQSRDRFLNFLPAFTVGFWHIVLPTLIHNEFTIGLGSKETAINDLKNDYDVTILVPALIDQIRIREPNIDFSKFRMVGCGSSAVLKRHIDFFFERKGKVFNHMYGASEIGAPILKKVSTSSDDYSQYLEMTPLADNYFKIVNDRLYVKGESLCSNISDFGLDDGWFDTNDRWIVDGNLIKFDGRTNDIVKLNGFQINLLEIETIAEDDAGLGECVTVVRNSLGTDWIELFFTKNISVDKNNLKKIFEKKLPDFAIPRKYSFIENIPRNGMGKKIRIKDL